MSISINIKMHTLCLHSPSLGILDFGNADPSGHDSHMWVIMAFIMVAKS